MILSSKLLLYFILFHKFSWEEVEIENDIRLNRSSSLPLSFLVWVKSKRNSKTWYRQNSFCASLDSSIQSLIKSTISIFLLGGIGRPWWKNSATFPDNCFNIILFGSRLGSSRPLSAWFWKYCSISRKISSWGLISSRCLSSRWCP